MMKIWPDSSVVRLRLGMDYISDQMTEFSDCVTRPNFNYILFIG